MFGKLLPREGNFFELFNQHADRIVEAARAFEHLVANYSDLHLREQYNRESTTPSAPPTRSRTRSTALLHKTFITPIDREQIHQLINAMDDILDLIQDVGRDRWRCTTCARITEEIMRLADICSVKCCERVKDAVDAAAARSAEPASPRRRSRPARRSTGSSPTPTA